MADLDLGISLEELGVGDSELAQLTSTKVEFPDDLDSFAAGFTTDWDIEVPEEVLQKIAEKKAKRNKK